MNESAVIWLALSACVLATLLLCTRPVVRAFSKQSVPREPPTAPTGVCLGTVAISFENPAQASSVAQDATGRLVRMKRAATGDYVFTLRHSWISADLGLPGAGLPLDGILRLTPGVAHASVFTPLGPVAFLASICAVGVSVSVGVLAKDPSVWNALCLAPWLWFACTRWRNAKRAVRTLAEDAVAVLNTFQERASRRTTS